MGLWIRAFFVGVVALALSGCVLESKDPLFNEADAKLLLADYPNPVVYEYYDGAWSKSATKAGFRAQGSHYLVKLDDAEMEISFTPIEGPWWALQAADPGKSTNYLLVKAAAKELLLYPIDCELLKGSGKFDGFVDFVDTDCTVKPGADKLALFKALTTVEGETKMKLVSEP